MDLIYSIAQHKVIYLGEPSVRSDSVFSDISSLLASSDGPLSPALLASICNDADLEMIYKGLETQILARPWFSRVWIFQELLLSRDPWVQCGTKRLRWGDLYQVSLLARDKSRHLNILKDELEDLADREITSIESVPDDTIAELPRRVGVLARLEDIHSARRKFQDYIYGGGTGNTLLALLASRRGLGVLDARDMIYAHLEVASDSISRNLRFKVDYTKSCPELFIDVTRYSVERHKDYNILSHVEDVDPLRRRPGLPSRVPDWTSTKVHDLHQNPPLPDNEPSAKFSFLLSAEGKYQLACKGRVFGKISTIGTNVVSFTHLESAEIGRSWNILFDKWKYKRETLCVSSKWDYDEDRKRIRADFEAMLEEVAEAAGFQGSASFQTCFYRYEYEWDKGLDKMVQAYVEEVPRAGIKIKLHPAAPASTAPFHFFPPNGRGKLYRRISDPAELRVLEGRRLCLYTEPNARSEEISREIQLQHERSGKSQSQVQPLLNYYFI